VDGAPFHPASRTARDHEPDRLYRSHGVRVVAHFDADACYTAPDRVVARFLATLDKRQLGTHTCILVHRRAAT
jgi:hypothetical protein